MQRHNHTSRANPDVLSHRSNRRSCDRWIWIGTAKIVEVTFRNPNRGEVVGIAEACGIEHELVGIIPARSAAFCSPQHETELQLSGIVRGGGGG
ncbi:MAG: hypothetical protein COA70_00700 [Planctomycetota bacterium]|nr:MAG: hypothetical protein COA70_00700 [Planctomycetota bacterium]